MTGLGEIDDAGDELVDVFDDAFYEYGRLGERAWASDAVWEGEMAIGARRPELLDDEALAAWWHDLKSWSTWAIHTFRLTRTFPPCWPQHPALVEELTALWMLWQSGWLPAEDPARPAAFLQQLDWSISRVERLWKAPCDNDRHKPQPSPVVGADGRPDLRRWWGNDNYNLEGATP